MYLQEGIEGEINTTIKEHPGTKVSSEITEILEQTPLISIKFYPPFSEETLFTGNGGFYRDINERQEIQKRQKQNFLESGYTSYYGKDGLHASGFSIISGRFLKNFEAKNKGMPGFAAGYGRPMSAGDFNFGDINSYAIGEGSYKDENNNTIIVPLYIIGKNGEGVVDEKQGEEFMRLIK